MLSNISVRTQGSVPTEANYESLTVTSAGHLAKLINAQNL